MDRILGMESAASSSSVLSSLLLLLLDVLLVLEDPRPSGAANKPAPAGPEVGLELAL